MAITPLPGWKLDPNNPGGVIQDGPPINLGSIAYGAYNTPPPPQQYQTRDLQLRSGDPATSLQSSGTQAQGVAQGSKFDGQAVIDLLQKYQKMAVTQGFNAQQQQIDAGMAQTPDSLIGASPSLQNSVRNAEQSAFNPTIQGANQTDVLLRDQISSVRSLLKDKQDLENKSRDDARAVIKDAFTLGGADSLKGLDATEIAALEKAAGYPKGYIEGVAQTIKERELQQRADAAAQKDALERYLAEQKNGPGGVKLTTSQQTALDNINTVQLSLKAYRDLYERLVGATGVNLTGADAGELAGAYNTLIFQIAQAAGTGALQAADREIVEAMIPNPTTIWGAVGGAVKGGKTGGLSAIDQASALFDNKKDAILNGDSNVENMQTIRVRRISDGQTGSLPEDEFDPSVYERL